MGGERLREVLHYNPDTGVFVWRAAMDRPAKWVARFEGKTAGRVDESGYRSIRVDGRSYLAHRLAWLYVYNEWPRNQIDHINRAKDDNRISNLRDVTCSLNNHNIGTKSSNTSGIPGVRFDASKKKWIATIRDNGPRRFLGRFANKDDAAAAYMSAKAAILLSHDMRN